MGTKRIHHKRALSYIEVRSYEWPENMYIDMFSLFQTENTRIDITSINIPVDFKQTIDKAFEVYQEYAIRVKNPVRNIWIVLDKYEKYLSRDELMEKYSLTKEGILRVSQSVLRQMAFQSRELLLNGISKYEKLVSERRSQYEKNVNDYKHIYLSSFMSSIKYTLFKRHGISTLSQLLRLTYDDYIKFPRASRKEFDNMVKILDAIFQISYDFTSKMFTFGIEHHYSEIRNDILKAILYKDYEKMREYDINNIVYMGDILTAMEISDARRVGIKTFYDIYTLNYDNAASLSGSDYPMVREHIRNKVRTRIEKEIDTSINFFSVN